MFHKKKDTEIDISSLNVILNTGRKLINIGYFMAIVCLALLGTYVIKEWNILKYVGILLNVISPIFIGFIVAWLCDPMVKALQNKKIPRVAACLIVYLGIIAFLGLLLWTIIPSLASQITDIAASLPDIFKDIKDFVDGLFKTFNNKAINTADIKEQIYSTIGNFAIEFTTSLPKNIFSIGKAIISGGLNVVLGLMVGFYLLFDFDKINSNIANYIPSNWKPGYMDLCNRINSSLRSYVQGLLAVMFLVFVTQSIGLTIAGLKAPLIFALFCALTDVIPYFGPYIGAIPAVIVGFTISPIVGICCIISIVVVQLLENNFYQPLIMGHTMKLHPVTIMIGLLIFQRFFGIIGMIIATPAIACIKVIATFIVEKVNENNKIIANEK